MVSDVSHCIFLYEHSKRWRFLPSMNLLSRWFKSFLCMMSRNNRSGYCASVLETLPWTTTPPYIVPDFTTTNMRYDYIVLHVGSSFTGTKALFTTLIIRYLSQIRFIAVENHSVIYTCVLECSIRNDPYRFYMCQMLSEHWWLHMPTGATFDQVTKAFFYMWATAFSTVTSTSDKISNYTSCLHSTISYSYKSVTSMWSSIVLFFKQHILTIIKIII